MKSDGAKGGAAPHDRDQLEVDQQLLEAEERPPVGVGHREVLDLQHERERVEADVPDLGLAIVGLGNPADELAAHDAWHEKEAGGRVGDHDASHGQPEGPAGEDAG